MVEMKNKFIFFRLELNDNYTVKIDRNVFFSFFFFFLCECRFVFLLFIYLLLSISRWLDVNENGVVTAWDEKRRESFTKLCDDGGNKRAKREGRITKKKWETTALLGSVNVECSTHAHFFIFLLQFIILLILHLNIYPQIHIHTQRNCLFKSPISEKCFINFILYFWSMKKYFNFICSWHEQINNNYVGRIDMK